MKENNIGATIKELRKRENLSQQDLADKLNTTNFNISKWENNITTPDIYYLKSISKIFNITIDDLMNNRLTKKRPNYIRILLIIIIIQFVFIIGIVIKNISNKKIIINNLYSTNTDISLKGILVANNSVSLIEINNIEYIDKNIGSNLEIVPETVSITLKSNKDTIFNKSIENYDKEPLDEILRKENISHQNDQKIEDLNLIIKYTDNNKTKEIKTAILLKNK